jgi:hypothetical protein
MRKLSCVTYCRMAIALVVLADWTAASLHALAQRSEVVAVAIAAPKYKLGALARLWIIAPPGEQGPAVSPHGWQMAHVL